MNVLKISKAQKLYMLQHLFVLTLASLSKILSNDRQWLRLCEKSGNTRKVQLRDQLKPVAQFMSNRIPKGCVRKFKTVSKPKSFAATMNRMVDLEKFTGDCKLYHKLDDNTFLAIIPYAHMWRSFTNQIFSAEFSKLYSSNGMIPIFVDLSITNSSRLVREYNTQKQGIVLVLDSCWAERKKFWKVIVPEDCDEIHEIYPGVRVKGKAGWIPAKYVAHGYAKNPSLYYRLDGDVTTVTFGFKPVRIHKTVVQWGA